MSKNKNTNDIAYSIGASKRIVPLYIVLTQLKTLTAVGIATKKVITEKTLAAVLEIPETNM